MVCHPLKNFGTDCYTNEYGVSAAISGTPTAQNVGSCNSFVGIDTDLDGQIDIDFTDPIRLLTHGAPSAHCTSTTDLDWNIYGGDEFSFEIYGAADSTDANDSDADGMDIQLDFVKPGVYPNPDQIWNVSFDQVALTSHCNTVYPCTD